MKPEPLKDKKNPVVEGQSYINLFKEKDIKSAVELLKGCLKQLSCKHDKLIDYCFPDLVKSEVLGRSPKKDEKVQ